MELGLGRLELKPDEFWKMTPAELKAKAYGRLGRPNEPMTNRRLKEMMERFPDGR